MRRPPASARGFTLISVLVALAVSALGVLAIVRLVTTATSASTQNQAVILLAPLGNTFWGVVQANPTMVTNSSFVGTFSSGNYATAAPAALRPWLAEAFVGNAPSRPPLPPGSTITIATSADSNGSACSNTGCTVTVTFSWGQLGAQGIAAATRTQTMYFQFPA